MVPTDGTGPLRFCLCGPGLCCGLGRAEVWKLLPSLVLQQAGGVTNCKRERGHGHSVSGAGSSACLSSNVWVVQPSPCALGLCPYTIYLCCCEHTRCLSQAGVGKHWWSGDAVGRAARIAAGGPTAQCNKVLVQCSEFCSCAQLESQVHGGLCWPLNLYTRVGEVTVISCWDATIWLVTS